MTDQEKVWAIDGIGKKRFAGFQNPVNPVILIDGTKIATEKLLHNKPGEFFDKEYEIPPERTKGKQQVTVKFQAHPGETAGGVFGCAILKREDKK